MIDTTMRSTYVKGHIASEPITSKADWKKARAMAAELQEWWDENNGSFDGDFSKGFAVHHAQVFINETADPLNAPYNFFVLSKELLEKDKKNGRDERNYTFPAQVIYNPEILTAIPTYLVNTTDKRGKTRKVAKSNVTTYKEACMSYRQRKEKNVERFSVIKVRYQTIGRFGRVKTHEEWIEGLKAHIFQHEVDHARGIDIFFGDGEQRKIPIDDRIRENGKTKEEIEQESEDYEKQMIDAIKHKNEHAVIEDERDGTPYLLRLDEQLPDGYVEGSLETYYNEDGTLKKEYRNLEVIESTRIYGEEEDT